MSWVSGDNQFAINVLGIYDVVLYCLSLKRVATIAR